MQRVCVAVIGMMLALPAARAEAGVPITLSNYGWTVTADPEQAVLSIGREGLGIVLQGVRLNLRGEHGLQRLKGWSVEKQGDAQISIRTSEPRTAWAFEPGAETLRISTTTAEGLLTAEAPASTGRIVARLLDPEGTPVNWVGTDEVKNGYPGATETHNPSFLPRRNPEVMYFALGQVSSASLHSLFDRKADTAIDFSEQATMKRSGQDANLLEVRIPVPGNTQVRIMPDYFTKTLGLPFYVPFDDSAFPRPPAVWSSWTSYYIEVKEEDIVRNADWIAANLKPYGFEYVELDGGYDGKEQDNVGTSIGTDHTWLNWVHAKFPHGPKWLTDYIKSKGLRAGLWIVPNASAAAVEEHPDWYLRYKDGKIVLDYNTPTLDSTNPQVLDFVKKEFTTLDDWGFDYYKFDGEHDFLNYIPGIDLDKIFDKSIDPIEAYLRRLKMIRDTIGPHRFIEGCPSGTPLDGIGFVNSYFNGQDVYANWQGMYNLFSSINGNGFLNHLAVYVMPGEGMELQPPMTVEEATRQRTPAVVETVRTREDPMVGLGTTLPEARTVVTYVALTGVVYPMASVMSELPEERVKLMKATLPTMPILPIDLFSRGTDAKWDTFKHTTPDDYIHNYPEMLDVKVNAQAGTYDIVALTNWRSWPTSRELLFADKLGVDPEGSYVAFDFWAKKILGVFKGKMAVKIAPHDTRVLLVHPLASHPQLVGTSRHITGVYSIVNLGWDREANRLRGTSETVPGDAYTLWVYVPKGVTLSRVRAETKGNTVVPVQHELNGNALKVTFAGQPESVDWEVGFGGKTS